MSVLNRPVATVGVMVSIALAIALSGCTPTSVQRAAEDPLQHPISNAECTGVSVTIGTDRQTVQGATGKFASVTVHVDSAFSGSNKYKEMAVTFYDATSQQDLGAPPRQPHDVKAVMPEGHDIRIGIYAFTTDGRQGTCGFQTASIPMLPATSESPSLATS